jgi:hypothetical protein
MRRLLPLVDPAVHALGVGLAIAALVRYASHPHSMAPQLGRRGPLAVGLLVIAGASSLAALAAATRRVWCGSRRAVTAGEARLLLYVLAGAVTFQFACLQPYAWGLLAMALGVAFGVHAWLAAAGSLVAPRLPQRALAVADLLLMNAFVLALGGEVAMRLLAMVRPMPLLVQSDGTVLERLRQYRLQPGSLRFGFPVNSLGDYDDEPTLKQPGRRLVVSIGDSFAIGVVPHDDHFTTVAERALGADVYNMGVLAIGPPEYLYLLRSRALPMAPDVVVVNLFIGNDVVGGTTHRLMVRLFDRGNLLIYQVPRRLLRIWRGRVAGKVSVSAGTSAPRNGPLTRDEVLRDAPWFADWAKEPPSIERGAFLQLESERALAVCTTGGDVESHYAGLFTELALMKAAAGRTPLVFMLIPDEFQVEDGLFAEILARTDRPLDRDEPQHRIGAWLEHEGVPYLDLLPIFRAVPPLADGARHLYHLQDTHLNVRGNRIAGERLAEFLRRYLPAHQSADAPGG